MAFTGSKADLETCQRLLDEGKSIREVAIDQGVSTQAVYRLIQRGTLYRGASDALARSVATSG